MMVTELMCPVLYSLTPDSLFSIDGFTLLRHHKTNPSTVHDKYPRDNKSLVKILLKLNTKIVVKSMLLTNGFRLNNMVATRSIIKMIIKVNINFSKANIRMSKENNIDSTPYTKVNIVIPIAMTIAIISSHFDI